jgi:hypothetical protein
VACLHEHIEKHCKEHVTVQHDIVAEKVDKQADDSLAVHWRKATGERGTTNTPFLVRTRESPAPLPEFLRHLKTWGIGGTIMQIFHLCCGRFCVGCSLWCQLGPHVLHASHQWAKVGLLHSM